MEETLDLKAVARLYGVSVRTVRRHILPRLPVIRIGRAVRVRRHDAERLLAEMAAGAAPRRARR